MSKTGNKSRAAFYFIVLMGIVSLFSDFTHEGARSIYGPFLGLLGASAATVSTVAGLGEFIAYAFILLTGFIGDKTKKYWPMTLAGYLINLVAIPLLAFAPANGWVYACVLIILERFGRSIRKPSKTALVSFAASEVGPGKGFAIQEALDQIGACLGPALLFVILTLKEGLKKPDTRGDYSLCFLALGASAVITLVILVIGWRLYPHPETFEKEKDDAPKSLKFNKSFWFYMAAISLVALGFADFPLISFHLVKTQAFSGSLIPLLYALAMGIDAAAALVFGSLFDKKGITSLVIAIALSAFFAPFVFLAQSRVLIIIGILLWGVGMGAQESILKAVVTSLVSKDRRATAYGIFNAGFGVFWFAGSALMGLLYKNSLWALAILSMAAQLAALPLLTHVKLPGKN